MSCMMNQCGGDGAHGRTVIDSAYHGRPEYGFYDDAEMSKMGAKVGGCGNSSSNQSGMNKQRKQRGGEGAHGRTVMDSSYYGRPEYGFYDDAEMAKMGAKVGGCGMKKQRGGDGAHGRTVFDSVYYGRPEYGFYDAAEMAKMGAKVGGCGKSLSQQSEMKKQQKQQKQRGGQNSEHLKRMRGIIANLIDISDAHDDDILDVLSQERKEDMQRYSKAEAKQMLAEYYVLHPEKSHQMMDGERSFPSSLLEKFVKKHQRGGNRVSLPLSYFTGEIPDKMTIPPYVDNYCGN